MDFELGPPRGDVYRGKEGERRSWRKYREAWDEFAVSVERIEAHGDEVLALVVANGTSPWSGIDISLRVGHVFTVRSGLIAGLRSSKAGTKPSNA